MNPASTMKLVTTYASLHLLGPGVHVPHRGAGRGPADRRRAAGDLYVRGGGDPKLVIEDLWLLVNRLRGFGIREIRGDIVLDKTFFEPLTHDPAVFDGEEGRAYNVGPDALLVNFKSIAMTFVPGHGGEGGARHRRARSRGTASAPKTVPGVEGACGDWRGRLRADIDDPMNIRIARHLSTRLRRARHLPRRARPH